MPSSPCIGSVSIERRAETLGTSFRPLIPTPSEDQLDAAANRAPLRPEPTHLPVSVFCRNCPRIRSVSSTLHAVRSQVEAFAAEQEWVHCLAKVFSLS